MWTTSKLFPIFQLNYCIVEFKNMLFQDYIIVLVVPEPVALQKWLKTKGHQNTEDVQRIFSNKVST